MIDGAVNGIGAAFRAGGGGLRTVQTGLVRNYALAIVVRRGAAARLRDDAGDALMLAARRRPPSRTRRSAGFPLLTAL